VTASRDALQQKNNELAGAYQDKSRKLFQTQELYNKVKKRAELSQIEQAAFDAVDSSTRSVPQLSTSNQASSQFRPHSLNGDNERSFPLNRGLPRFDAADFATAPPVSNMQQYESESRWPRKRPQAYGEAYHICGFNFGLTHNNDRTDSRSSTFPSKRKRPTLCRDFSP
jgi:E3 ubiquitin-protein ligase CCNP1IP1